MDHSLVYLSETMSHAVVGPPKTDGSWWRVLTKCGSLEKERKKVKLLSLVGLFVTPWSVAYHAPLSMVFSRQQYWSGLPFPSPEDLPKPGVEPASPALTGGFVTAQPPGKAT